MANFWIICSPSCTPAKIDATTLRSTSVSSLLAIFSNCLSVLLPLLNPAEPAPATSVINAHALSPPPGNKTSSKSSGPVYGIAPWANNLLHPLELSLVISPGATINSLFWFSACVAVFSDPLLSAASAINTASDNPEINLLRCKNRACTSFLPSGRSSGPYSEIIAPPFSTISCANLVCDLG